MNNFLVLLKGKMNEHVRHYFEEKDIEITFFDELLPDLFICKTPLTLESIKEMEYVDDVRLPRTGTLS